LELKLLTIKYFGCQLEANSRVDLKLHRRTI
jgi:hypothetical protein